jgi:hypothetical protein
MFIVYSYFKQLKRKHTLIQGLAMKLAIGNSNPIRPLLFMFCENIELC